MKKLIFAAASLVLATSAMAQSGADVKINGELRARFTGQENEPGGKSSWDNATEQRTKVGFTFTKSEDLTAHVSLLAAGTWGNSGSTNVSAEIDPTDTENNVKIFEAWAFWKALDNVALRVGRGGFDLGDKTVVAKNDYEQLPYVFEGVLATYFHEMVNVNLFAVKGMDDDATNTADVNFYGISADLKLAPEIFKLINIHALQSKATGIDTTALGGAPGTKDERLRLGLTLQGETSGVDYRGTYAMQTGETVFAGGTKRDSDASMYDLEAGYRIADMMNFRVHGLYHSDSGSSSATKNETYDAFYYDLHDNAGLADIIGWGNLTYWKIGVSVEPAEMLTVGLDYYAFSKTEKADGVYAAQGAGGGRAAIAGTAGSDDDVGSEIDLYAKKVLSNGAELNARYSMFQAGDAFGAGKEDVSQYQIGATFRF